MRYAIRFDFPELDGPLYAGDSKGAAGFAPSLDSAFIYENREVADRTLTHAYPLSISTNGRVIAVRDDRPVEIEAQL